MILHLIRMRDRLKTSSMIANLLNRTDAHNLQYSTRKLIAQKLVTKVKHGAGKVFRTHRDISGQAVVR